MNEKRGKITDKQFFTSRLFAGRLEEMAAAQSKRHHYSRRVHVELVWQPSNPDTAKTDNSVIWINCGNPVVTKVKGRVNRYWIIIGLFTHELGHVLFTDFLASLSYNRAMEAYRWYPEPPVILKSADARNEKDMWEYIKDSTDNRDAVIYISHFISNVLEDGFTDDRMLKKFPGTLGMGLQTYRDLRISMLPTVTEMIEEENDGDRHIFDTILQNILSYVRFGQIKYGHEPLSEFRIKSVFELINELDRAVITNSAKERLGIVNLILIRFWEQIKDYCEIVKDRMKAEAAAGAAANMVAAMAKATGAVGGATAIAVGNTGSLVEGDEEEESSSSAERAASHEDAEENTGEQEDNSSGDVSKEKEQPGGAANAGMEGGSAKASGGSAKGKQKTTDQEGGRIPLKHTSKVSAPVGGTVTRNPSYEREKYERAATDIERVLDKMAEKAACAHMENERTRALNEAAQNISYGNIHEGVNIRVHRINSVDEDLIDDYNQVAAPLLSISRQLQRSLTTQLQDYRRGGKMTGLLMGRRLDSHALHRMDGKIFTKNNLPNETPELAVGLLLDESGSMHSYDRCTYARASAIILYDFCTSLDIPVMVYGHSTGSNCVDLYSYAEFDAIDRDDRYRMMDIAARGSNRDGAALRFVADQLSKRPEAVKILIIVSDGQPADTGYYGTAAEEDLRGIKQEYQKKGILFVAAAIGNDKQNIERIYGDSFMDITDLNTLPVKLTSLVKRHIRV